MSIMREKNPNILAIGTRINKNLERIIEAVKDINCTLTIIGILTDYQAKLLESSGVVYENYFRIPNSKVLELYKNSDIVCFPSLYEGFGRPIVEAQAIGRAVVTSNLEPMKQVAGDSSACLVDPYDVLDIRKGIMKVIEDDKYREGIIEKGLENVKQYRADIIAKKYEDIYGDEKLSKFVYKHWGDRKMLRTFPNLKVQDVDGNMIYMDNLLSDIQPYYYKFNFKK